MLDPRVPTIGAWINYGLGSLSDSLPQFINLTNLSFPIYSFTGSGGPLLAQLCQSSSKLQSLTLSPRRSGVAHAQVIPDGEQDRCTELIAALQPVSASLVDLSLALDDSSTLGSAAGLRRAGRDQEFLPRIDAQLRGIPAAATVYAAGHSLEWHGA